MEARYALTKDFTDNLGTFYGLWLALEATIEYEIGRLLNLPDRQTHIVVAGMEFGRKASLFHILLNESDWRNKDEIGTLLTSIQNEAKRNIFTHSILHSVEDEVTFIHRKVQGHKFSVTETKFTRNQFGTHVRKMIDVANKFGALLDIDQEDFHAFCETAHNVSKSPSTSPQPPSSKA
jgi:hypothetical protein